MNEIIYKILMVGLVLAIVGLALPLCIAAGKQLGRNLAANANTDGTHAEGVVTRQAEEAISTRYLIVKQGTTKGSQVLICDEDEAPYAISLDEPEADDYTSFRLLGGGSGTALLVASEAITADDDLYVADNGKVQDEPTSAGTYYRIGKAVTAASGDGVTLEALVHAPVKVVVIAALTSTNGTAAAASANLANLAAEAEKIGDDVRAIAAALATPAEVKVLAS